MVNLPNWLPLRFRFRDGGAWFTPDDGSLLEHRQDLDLRHATLTRTFRLRDPRGRILAVEQTRLVHMQDPHLAALRTVFRAEGAGRRTWRWSPRSTATCATRASPATGT